MALKPSYRKAIIERVRSAERNYCIVLPDIPPAAPPDVAAPTLTVTQKRNALIPGISSRPTLECFVKEAERHSIDPFVLLAVMKTEGGRPGEVALNKNGTFDLGPMSVNTVWLPSLAKHYRTTEPELRIRLASDGCANVAAGALILKRKIQSSGSLWEGVANYHSSNPVRQARYLMRVHSSLTQIAARIAGTSR